MSKRVPCNECREHKRGCSGEMPCQRCQRFNLKCVYTINKSPKDEEYIQELEMRQQLDTLRHQVAIMEKELDFLRIAPPPLSKGTLSETSTHSVFSSPPFFSEQSSPASTTTELSDEHHHDKQIIAQNNKGYYVSVDSSSEGQLDWTLTISNGNLSIKTNIRNHNDLLCSMQKIISTLEFQDKVPNLFCKTTEPNPISKVLRFLMWKRYGKSRYKSVSRDTRLLIAAQNVKGNNTVVDGSTVTLQLIDAYMNCQHFLGIQMHRPTFRTLFVEEGRADFSPAAMALCAVTCMQSCRHVRMVIPGEQLLDYGRYYAERALETLSDRFDEISLEIHLSYVFLSLYKMRMSQIEDGVRYADMAERMTHVLERELELPPDDASLAKLDPLLVGKASLFHRSIQALVRARMLGSIILHNEAEEAHKWDKKKRQKLDYARLHAKVHGENEKIRPVVGDSPEEIRYIKAFIYMQNLRLEAHKVVHNFQSNDLLTFVGMFGHQLEMVMRRWYNLVLPPDYRLSAPLFDDTIPEDRFYDILDRECSVNMVPLITTMRVYGEYLIMAKSYMPQSPDIGHFGDKCDNTEYKMPKRIEKLLRVKEEIEFEGTEEEYLRMMFAALRIDPKDLRSSLADLAVRTSVCTLRILRFVNSRDLPVCTMQMLLVYDSWEVLKRVGRIYLFIDGGATSETLRLRTLLEGFLDLAKDVYSEQPYNEDLRVRVKEMEEELESDLSVFVPYHAKDPDFSYYLNI
ncbi:hypothetical protein BJV82DRAFT_343906 [Fennellomyces sp. T-0311]|nr:hypothetical protein BJV82DRAFT_343906 [Fennellomyces sp. T-0311]